MITKGCLARFRSTIPTSAGRIFLVLSDKYTLGGFSADKELSLYVDVFMNNRIVSMNVRRLKKVQ